MRPEGLRNKGWVMDKKAAAKCDTFCSLQQEQEAAPSYMGNAHLGVEMGGPPGVVRMKSIAKCSATTFNDINLVPPGT